MPIINFLLVKKGIYNITSTKVKSLLILKFSSITSSSSENLTETLGRIPKILIVKPPRGLGMLGLPGGGSGGALFLLLLLLGGKSLRFGHVFQIFRRWSGLKLEIAIRISDDPWNEESFGLRFRVFGFGSERDVEFCGGRW